MKPLLLVSSLSLMSMGLSSQNLIPNPSFEAYIECPSAPGQIENCEDWYEPSLGSADYYHECSTSNLSGVPVHGIGFQYARTGEAFAGIPIVSNVDNYRGYLSIELITPLEGGVEYHLEFYMNARNRYRFASDVVGAYFSEEPIEFNSSGVLPYTPQIENAEGNFPDTLNWTPVTGSFIAQGGERFMTIGNFYNDANTDLIVIDDVTTFYVAYILVEDFTLIAGPLSSEGEFHSSGFRVYPNPSAGHISILSDPSSGIMNYWVYDMSGRTFLEGSPAEVTKEINLQLDIPPGMYILELEDEQRRVRQFKIIVR